MITKLLIDWWWNDWEKKFYFLIDIEYNIRANVVVACGHFNYLSSKFCKQQEEIFLFYFPLCSLQF